MRDSLKYLIIALLTFVVGYLFLKTAFYSQEINPYVQEVILIILGTIVTIFITAALLNKQSEVELEKEQRVKIFDKKAELYFELIDFIEDVIRKQKIDHKDLITLEFLTHKISIIANSHVLIEYSNLVDCIKKTADDQSLSTLESDELSAQLAKLCGKIRYDLITKEVDQDINIQSIIDKNIHKI
jgi:hypothetical protein